MNLFDCVTYSHLLTPDIERYPMSHGAYIEALAPDRLAISWFAGSREWATDVQILGTVFQLPTRRWEPIADIANDIGQSLGNSVVAKDSTGRTHLWYIRTRRYWQDGEVVHMIAANGELKFEGKEVLPLPPGWLIRGRPVIRGNFVYLPVYQELETVAAVWEQDLSSPEGSLGEFVGAAGGLIQPVLVPVGDREFRGFFRNPWSPNRIHHAYSMDRGATWSKPHATDLPNPNSGIDIVALALDIFICVYNDSITERNPLSLALSTDRGMRWRKIGDLERESEEFSYPSLIQNDGSLYLVYTFKRRAIKFISFDSEKLLRMARP